MRTLGTIAATRLAAAEVATSNLTAYDATGSKPGSLALVPLGVAAAFAVRRKRLSQ
jgi:MYXO-CTERM domain-containing protein